VAWTSPVSPSGPAAPIRRYESTNGRFIHSRDALDLANLPAFFASRAELDHASILTSRKSGHRVSRERGVVRTLLVVAIAVTFASPTLGEMTASGEDAYRFLYEYSELGTHRTGIDSTASWLAEDRKYLGLS